MLFFSGNHYNKVLMLQINILNKRLPIINYAVESNNDYSCIK